LLHFTIGFGAHGRQPSLDEVAACTRWPQDAIRTWRNSRFAGRRPRWQGVHGAARSFPAEDTCNNRLPTTAMQAPSSELARSVLDAAPDAMIIIDDTGRIRFANRQVSALFGYSYAEIIGLTVEQLMPERFRMRHIAHRHGYAEALRPRAMGEGLALFGRRLDGAEFPVEISLSPIHNGKQLLVAAAIRDVSDRKRVENELRAERASSERARDMADRLREIADEARTVADEARESADRANQAKSRFLATASHDLRQPLQTLALLNGILRRVVREPSAL